MPLNLALIGRLEADFTDMWLRILHIRHHVCLYEVVPNPYSRQPMDCFQVRFMCINHYGAKIKVDFGPLYVWSRCWGSEQKWWRHRDCRLAHARLCLCALVYVYSWWDRVHWHRSLNGFVAWAKFIFIDLLNCYLIDSAKTSFLHALVRIKRFSGHTHAHASFGHLLALFFEFAKSIPCKSHDVLTLGVTDTVAHPGPTHSWTMASIHYMDKRADCRKCFESRFFGPRERFSVDTTSVLCVGNCSWPKGLVTTIL